MSVEQTLALGTGVMQRTFWKSPNRGASSALRAGQRSESSDSDNRSATRLLGSTGAAERAPTQRSRSLSCGMDSLDAASLASALPELPPQPGILSQLRSIQRDSFNWERRVAGRCKLVGNEFCLGNYFCMIDNEFN